MKRDKTVIAALRGYDKPSYSTKTGEYIVKRGFFYCHGRSADTLATSVQNDLARQLPGRTVTLTRVQEHYNAWPRDSWWEVRFIITEAV